MHAWSVARAWVAVLAMAVLLAMPGPLLPGAQAAPVSWTGDRTIYDNQSYSGDLITLSGNLTVRGSLTFRGVELQVNSPSNATFRIDVEKGGAFNVLAGSRIHSTDDNIHFAFQVRPGATFVMNDSELNDCGWDDIENWKTRPVYERGLYIEGTNASVTNSTLTGNYMGIILDQLSSAWIYKNNISGNEGNGIYVCGGSTPVIDRNTVSDNLRYSMGTLDFGGITSVWSSPVISNNTISANLDRRSDYGGGGIIFQGGGTPSVLDNEISGHNHPSYIWGLQSNKCSATIRGNRIHNNSNGLSLHLGVSVVENNLIENNNATGYGKDGIGLSDGSASSFRRNTISGSNFGLCLLTSTSWFENVTVVRNARGVDELGGVVQATLANCTFVQNGWDVRLEGWGYGNYYSTLVLLNPAYNEKSVAAVNEGDHLSVRWFVRTRVLYENGSRPAGGAEVRFGNALGSLAATCQTGPDGWTDAIVLEEYCLTVGQKAAKSPYNISALSGWRSNWTGWTPVNRSREVTIVIDDIPPLLTLSAPANNSFANRTSVTASGYCEPGARLYVNREALTVRPDGSWSAPVQLDAEGANEMVAEAYDRCGNRAVERCTVFRDTAAPVLSLTSPRDGFLTNRSNISVNGSCSDPAARTTVNGRTVSLGPEGGFSVSVDLAEGPNAIVVESIDSAGNAARAVIAGERDSTPPWLRVLAPAPGLLTNVTALTVRGLADAGSDVTVNGLRCRLDEMEFEASVLLQEGANTIRVTARDRAGNLNTSSVAVTLDTLAPPLSIESPRDGELRNTSRLEIWGTTEAGASLTVNGVAAELSGGRFCVTLQLPDGQNRIALEVSDAAGNRALKALTVRIDTVAPGLTLSGPPDRMLTNLTVIEVRGRTDAGAIVTVNGQVAPVGKDGAFSAQADLGQEGENAITVRSRDAAWNVAESAVTVLRDTVLRYNITGPAKDSKVKTKAVVVSGDAEQGARITIGNLTIFPGADGRFSKEFQLEYGPNVIPITIRDPAGNEAAEMLNVTRLRPSSPAPSKGFIPGFTTAAAVAAAASAIIAAGMLRRRKGN